MTSRRKSVKRKKLTAGKVALFLVILALALGGGLAFYPFFFSEDGGGGSEPNPIEAEGQTDEVDISVVCAGDIMVHKPQIASQYDEFTDTYNYDNNFSYVKKYIETADLALCNVETTFAGGKPTGYPSFNAPDELADAVHRAGFDVAMTSNNHTYDRGLSGIKRTLRVLRGAGLATAGTRLPWEKNYALVSVKGLSVAVVSYTYETPKVNGKTTINSVVIPDEAASLICSFAYETLDEDLDEVGSTINAARKAGADLVICYYHWGEEYEREPNRWQEYIAEKTVDMGADIIFASHPHVIQRMEMLNCERTGKEVPVFYSLGNFISNQRMETLNNRYTEQGMIGRVRLTYDRNINEIKDVTIDSMNTWVEKYKSGSKDVYVIIPLDDDLENNEILKISGHLDRAKQASGDVISVLGSNYIWKE